MEGKEWLLDKKIKFNLDGFRHHGKVIGHPLSLADLIKNDLKRVIPNKEGVYYLFNKGELVYIGISNNIRKRLFQHYKEKLKDFDNVLWFCSDRFKNDRNKLIKLEKNLIKYYKPIYNIHHSNN